MTAITYGPCQPWIDGAAVAEYDPNLGVGSDTHLLDGVADAASQLLFELSGRQYPGSCERVVRPCRQACSCWGETSAGLAPWFWSTMPWTSGGAAGLGWGWYNDCGDTCGCGTASYIRLAGVPVTSVTEILIGGEVVDPSTYRLDGQNIIRLADLSTDPPTPEWWPVCQDLSLPPTEPGTYQVTYEWGIAPSLLGQMAAAQLAAELWKASPANQGECRLPQRVTRVVRQGITFDKIVSTADLLRSGMTGLQLVDSFLSMVNPQKARMRSAVFSPDQGYFPRETGF